MFHSRRLLAAFALLCLTAWPAFAASTNYLLSAGTWTKIGSAGQSLDVEVLSPNPIMLATSTGAPATNAGQQILGLGSKCWTLTEDLYAEGLTGPATAAVLTGVSCGGGGAGGGSSGFGTTTITSTRVTLTAATSAALISANGSRKSLRWMNTGANPMTCAPGTGAVVAGIGMNYDPGSSTANQGGGTSFDGGPVPTNAFSCISTGGTSVTVWEGN